MQRCANVSLADQESSCCVAHCLILKLWALVFLKTNGEQRDIKGTVAPKSHATGVENHKSPEEKSSQRWFWQQLIRIVLWAVVRRHWEEEEEEKAERKTAPKNHGDVAISAERLQIPGNWYKPTSGDELWMEMKCMLRARLSTGDVIYCLAEICFPSWRAGFATWHVRHCAPRYTVMDYSEAIKYNKPRWYAPLQYVLFFLFPTLIKPDDSISMNIAYV